MIKNSLCQNSDFFDRSFTWSLIYFSAKFLEILMTGSLEIGMFLLKQSVSIFRATAHALHLTGFFREQTKAEIAGFFASLPFPRYLCNKRLKSSIHCVQL